MADGTLFGELQIPRRVYSAGLVIDLYAGGGGASEGIRAALGRDVDIAANHCANAIEMHGRNHPDTLHLQSDVDAVRIPSLVGAAIVWLLWASPTCTHHSRARGKAPKSKQLREQGWSVLRWVRECMPMVLCCENVTEWEDWGPLHPDDHPEEKLRGQAIKERKGETWREWVQALREFGYVVEWRRMIAADYGERGAKIGSGRVNATTRERLFVIARRDGLPIVWPAPTHGKRTSPGVKSGALEPWKPVADCIDWSIPMCSIFATAEEAKQWARERRASLPKSERKNIGTPQRPLADATMKRVAEGAKRFVFSKKHRPFIVNLSHGGRVEDITQPANTITATPKGGDRMVVAPLVAKAHSNGSGSLGVVSGGDPLGTNTTTEQFAVVGVGLVNTRNGERKGQAPRVRDLEEPAPTATAKGSQGGVAAAWCIKHYGNGVLGHGVDQPLGTVTAVDHHSVGAVFIDKLHGSARSGTSAEDPCPTVAAGGGRGGGHAAVVEAELRTNIPAGMVRRARQTAAFLSLYYSGGGISSSAADPCPTIPTKDRLALILVTLETCDGPATLATVEIDGALWIVVDIAMRMLTPRELARAQGFADSYWLPPKKSDAIARIGNSVVPQCAEAIVRANLPQPDSDLLAAK